MTQLLYIPCSISLLAPDSVTDEYIIRSIRDANMALEDCGSYVDIVPIAHAAHFAVFPEEVKSGFYATVERMQTSDG